MSHLLTDGSSAPAIAGGPQPATENSLRRLLEFGQSLWLDDLRRSLFTSGEFSRLIAEDGLRGVTSNPSIFERAFAADDEYRTFLRDIERADQMDRARAYELLAIRDVRDAADLLRPVYDLTDRADGYASLEVSPYVAYDSQATISEARRLWHAIGRDNVMIKVPASRAGLPAVRQLTSEGINVNITLLFGVDRYEEVARAYMDGLSIFIANGGDATTGEQRRKLLRESHRHGDRRHGHKACGTSERCLRARATHGPVRPSRYRECEARVSTLLDSLPHARHGRRSPPRAPAPNVCCGRAPVRRTFDIEMFATWRN